VTCPLISVQGFRWMVWWCCLDRGDQSTPWSLAAFNTDWIQWEEWK